MNRELVSKETRQDVREYLATWLLPQIESAFRAVWSRLNISFDDFIRTTETRHRRAVETLIQRSFDAGDIYEGVYEGFYCVSCEEFKPEKGLVDGLCPIHRTKPDWIKERNYFFRLSKYRDRLLRHYAEHPEFVEPESRRNEMLRLLEGGLEDISVSRAGQAWGIPVPFDPASVVYVWFDALINYIAAVGYGTDQQLFDTWWPANLHVVGKDITRFHCVVWPAMLFSVGVAPARRVFGHGWVLTRGEKMSKSLGTVLDPLDAAERFGADPLRLYLTKEIVFGSDGDFTWDRFEEKYNVDLANNLGNLVNRVTAMAERYRHGRLVGPGHAPPKLAAAAESLVRIYAQAMDRFALEGGAAAAFRLVDASNEYIAASEPWALAKDDGRSADLDAVLWNASEALRIAAVLFAPIMPAASAEILDRLGVPDAGSDLRLKEDGTWRLNGERHAVRKPALWPRIEDASAGSGASRFTKEPVVTDHPNSPVPPTALPSAPVPDTPTVTAAGPTAMPAGSLAEAAAPAPASLWPADQRISIDDFMKIDLRVAKVLTAERVAGSKKLIKMQIDLGTEQRTLVAGIAEAYEADALVGRSVVIVANLKPAKLMGIESNGMVLAASPEGGKPLLVSFEQAPPPGSRVR
jgi:methionyl-tRNA synthetase